MTERFRERMSLNYLSNDFDEHSTGSRNLRSTSPTGSNNGGQDSPQNKSKSPRIENSTESSLAANLIRDSRPDIIAWPTPPTTNLSVGGQEDISDDPSKLLSILRVASSNPPRGRENELKKKIQTLEDTVAEYERQKYNVMGTFSEYRERVAERERKLEAEYSSKIIALSEEVLGAKKDFGARMKTFQALQEKFEREKEQALEKLRQEHQKEIQLLEQRFSESQLLNLEQKYMIEIQRLEEERKSLKAEKERLGETFEVKLRRAQSLYETELTAAKMLYSKELEALRDHEEALKEELLARQDEFHDRLQELQHQSKRSREELAVCKNEVFALEKRLKVKEAEVFAISKELEEARNETNDSLQKLSKVECELQETKQQYQEQEEELQRKSNLLNIVETAKSKLEAVIRDLQTEVKALKNKVEFLEKERKNLQSQSESQTKLQNSQVNALEAVLETVTKEKESTKEHYEGLLDRERQQAEEREYAMKKEFTSKLNELEAQYNNLRDHLDRDSQRNKEDEISTLKEEKNTMINEAQSLKLKLELLMADGKGDEVDAVRKIKKLIDESDELKKEVEKYKEIIEKKENELKSIEHKHEITDEQLTAIKDEIRYHLLNSSEFIEKDEELSKLNAKIIVMEAEREHSAMTHDETVAKLQAENDDLHARIVVLLRDDIDLAESKDLQNDVKEKRIEELMLNEKRLKDEFQSKLEERVEEETLKISSMYDEKLKQTMNLLEENKRKMEEEMKELKTECAQKSKRVTELNKKNVILTNEIGISQSELQKKNDEIKHFSKKTDEYLRKRENQQIQVLENKLSTLIKEHDKTLEQIKKQQVELNTKHENYENRTETVSLGIQTVDAEIEKTNANPLIDEESVELNSKLRNLECSLKEKNKMVTHLQEELLKYQEFEFEGKKNRSHSFTAGEGIKTRSSSKNSKALENEANTSGIVEKTAEAEWKNKEEIDVSKSKKRNGDREKSSHSTTGIPKPKSPAHSGRLHEKSPVKSKSPSVDIKQKDDTKTLSGRDIDRPTAVEERRRSSPGHQLPSRSKKESGLSTASFPNPPGGKEEQKRPAWKF